MNYYSVVFLTVLLCLSVDSAAAQANIVGPTTELEIRTTFPVFDIYTKRYIPDSTAIAFLKEVEEPVEIIIVLGTWCKDSKKYVPALFKVLVAAANKNIKTRYIGIDYLNKDSDNTYYKYELNATPAFIVFKKGDEAGRIVEKPGISLEVDLVNILVSSSER